MTDQTNCPHCGAYRDNDRSGIWFDCGSGVVCDHPVNSTLCELRTLRAKVAAQQELLKEAADALRTLKHWAAIYSEYNHETLNACIDNAAEVLKKLEEVK